jgi:GTP-binding protein
VNDLIHAMLTTVPSTVAQNKTENPVPAPAEGASTIIVTVIGRPNVGKSTLVNRFVGYERMKTGPQAGITTDAVQTSFIWKQNHISIVDTAGLRRKTAGRDTLEHLSCRETQRAIVFTHVALVVIDASVGIDRQDLIMVDKAWEEGRGVIVVLNKWDQVSQPQEWLRNLPPSITRHAVCPVSGMTGWGLNAMWSKVIEVYQQWNHRLPTGPLNRWLAQQVTANPPPMIHTHRIKIKYITQTKTRPPTFALFGSCVKELPPSYQRYLVNRLMKDFGLPSARLNLTNAANPYHQASDSSS